MEQALPLQLDIEIGSKVIPGNAGNMRRLLPHKIFLLNHVVPDEIHTP